MNGTEHFKPYSRELVHAGLLLLCVVFLLLAGFILWQEYEKQNLRRQLELLEVSLEQQRENTQLQLDSLQDAIFLQREGNRRLKDSLEVLQQKRIELKKAADEKKAAIVRIRDIDSLRDAVARHYSRS